MPYQAHRARASGRRAHGAFTWGVLDRLLEDERIEIEAISGTSAGAMYAVVLANVEGIPAIGAVVDAVMASACLPLVFRAVEIGGEAYWDGGYLRCCR